jgi:hypothetical protein
MLREIGSGFQNLDPRSLYPDYVAQRLPRCGVSRAAITTTLLKPLRPN